MKKNENIYIESHVSSGNKRDNTVSGDYTVINRTANWTDFILADGIGSGINANIAAIASASRLMELINQDISMTRAAEKIVDLMKRARTESVPFSTFTLVRIMRNGQYTIINYENPAPLLLSGGMISEVNMRHFALSQEIISEANGILSEGDSLILTSDGVTQAGLGILPGYGWGTDGLIKFIKSIKKKDNKEELAGKIVIRAYELSDNVFADDTTVSILSAREGKVLNLISGPPFSRDNDIRFTMDFIKQNGKKVICGSSTADMVSRVTGKSLKDVKISTSFTQPPKYFMEGIDLVTEGAVTLNQVYNILDEDPETFDRNSCVSELASLLINSDEINIFMGVARNEGHNNIAFRQLGVLERRKIIPLIQEKLKELGKLVNIKTM